MANINIEFDGKIYTVDENTLAPLASPLERALIQQLAGTGAVIRLGGTNYDVDADKLASARNVLTDNLGNVAGTDNKVIVNGTEYGLSKTKLQGATDKMNETLDGVAIKASEGLEYELNTDGVSYSVIGIGTCTDRDIIMPTEHEGLPVTSIGVGAFYDCDSLWSITIPDSIMNIGYNAFCLCSNLTSVIIGNGIIGGAAFENCNNLTSVTMGNGVTSIGDRAFLACYNLTSIAIPNSVTSIGGAAFEECSSLTSVTIPDNVTSIGWGAFSGCRGLTSVTIPNSVTSIDGAVFQNCLSLKSITIPDGVTSIGYAAFDNCSSLTNVTIPNSVTSIGDFAFQNCPNLRSITISDSVTSIGDKAFYGCSSLMSIIIPVSVVDMGSTVFTPSMVVFVESAEIPNSWNSNWNNGCTFFCDYDGIEREYTFETDGGAPVDSIVATYIETLPTASKDNHYLIGWYTDPEFSSEPVSNYYYSKTHTTLYAKWATEEEWLASKDGSSFDRAILATVGNEYTVTITEPGQYYYFEFTPDETEYYLIQASGNDDTYGYLYDSRHNQISSNDDYDGLNFGIEQELTAGQTYYVAARLIDESSQTGEFKVTFEFLRP